MSIKDEIAGAQVVLRRKMSVSRLAMDREAVLTTDALYFIPGLKWSQEATVIPLCDISEMRLVGADDDSDGDVVIECDDGTSVRFEPADGHKYVPGQWIQAISDCIEGRPQDDAAYAAMIDTSPQAEWERSRKRLEETIADSRKELEFAKGVVQNFAKGGHYSTRGLIKAVKKTNFQQNVKPEIEDRIGVTAAKEKVAYVKRSVEKTKEEAVDAVIDTVDVFDVRGKKQSVEKAKEELVDTVIDTVDVFDVRGKKTAVEAKAKKAVVDKITGESNSAAGGVEKQAQTGGHEESAAKPSSNDEGRGVPQETKEGLDGIREDLEEMREDLREMGDDVREMVEEIKDMGAAAGAELQKLGNGLKGLGKGLKDYMNR